MKPHHIFKIGNLMAIGLVATLVCFIEASSANAQAIQFRAAVVRVTVPLGTTNSTTITNVVNLTGGAANANFDVSGLPAGAGYSLTDTNGNALLSTAMDTNLWLTVNTTNIAEGIYTFSLNAGGLDTNGVPVTNNIKFVLQAAHVWTGSFNVSNNFANASGWLGGVPSATSDVVFGDSGAQTNIVLVELGGSGIAFTNVGIDANTTISSLRFSQGTYVNTNELSPATNALYYSLRIAPAQTLSITGTNGFSLLRDYIGAFINPDRTMGVNIAGDAMVVSNASADISVLVGNQLFPELILSNLNNFVTYVSRVGIGDYQLYPNYRNYNDNNGFGRQPRVFTARVYMAKTNIITAIYKDPDNYTNEFTRGYAFSFLNNETAGNGSSVNNFLYFGRTNKFFMDSVCFIGANSASGNGGVVRFNPAFANAGAIFRSTNGGRMTLFAISDDGGTNQGNSNVKANIDFASGNGVLDLLADKLIIARDRTLLVSNQSVNVTGDLLVGKGIVDVNTAILGFQEHDGKTNWTAMGAEAYLGYCRGSLVLTNGGTFKVNGDLILGYTADTNPEGAAQQYNTWGRVTVHNTNSTLIANNIIVDGGLNWGGPDHPSGTPRQNTITVNGGTLIVSNSIGASPGLPLDSLSMNGATLTLFVDPSRTNVYVKSFNNPGTSPTLIRVVALTGVSNFPAQIPIISYQTATPFLVANATAVNPTYSAYILNNIPNNTIDLYITTNPPNSLIWRGDINNDWDSTTANWQTVGGLQTNFTLGDTVRFDDSSSVTNVNIVGSVVPGQTGAGVTVSNITRSYFFSGGTIAGTSLLLKQGTNTLTIDATKQGPVNLTAGTLNGSGTIGFTTMASNTILNYVGTVNGGLTSTGTVVIANSLVGPVSLQGGSLVNNGTIDTRPGSMTIASGAMITNNGTMTVAGGAAWTLSRGSTLANFGTINLGAGAAVGRLNSQGTIFGNGFFYDADGGLNGGPPFPTGVDNRLGSDANSVLSPGATLTGSIGVLTVGARVDINNTLGTGIAQLRIEVDFANPQTNDMIMADKWNNITGILLMTNINPGAGSFSAGQSFLVFSNNNGADFFNFQDVNGTYPIIQPTVPAPGLQWGIANFRGFGSITVTTTPLVWDGSGSATWDTNSSANNWKSGQVFTENLGAMFDDSAAGSTTINIATTVAPAGIGVIGPFTNIVVGVSTNIFSITNVATISPGIVVSNSSAKPYIFAGNGKITGLTSLYKTGPGILTILTTNDFNGSTIIAGGTLAISNTTSPGPLGLAGSGSWINEVFIDGATLKYMGLATVNLGRGLVINANGATIEVSSSTNELTVNTAAIGEGSLTKTGPGVLVLSQAGDAYTGGTIISEGRLRLSAAAAGFGDVTIGSGTTLQLTNSFTLTNQINSAGAGNLIHVLGNSIPVLTGALTGSGTLTVSNANRFSFGGDLNGFSGTISFGTSSGTFQFNFRTNNNPCTGSLAATFDLGTGTATLSNYNGANLTYNLGGLAGGSNTILGGQITNSGVWPAGTTYSIGANGSSTVFSGKIANGLDTVSVVKIGSGALLLNGNSTYTGSTIVSNGVLGGTGSIASPLTVVAGGTLSPGASIGTFTVSNNATLGGTTVMELNRANSPAINDLLVVTGTLTGGGTLVVTNIGPDIYNGSTFKLFNQAVSGWSSKTLPATDPTGVNTYNWTDNIGVDGSITLVSGGAVSVNTNSTNIVVSSVSGSTMTLTWPADHIGWTLQVQTNSLSVGIGTNWFAVAGSSTTNQVTIPLTKTNDTVFFRLVYP